MTALTATHAPSYRHLRAVPPLQPHARPQQPRLRLTKRGRAVFTALAAAPLVIAAIVMTLSGGDAAATLQDSNVTFEYVTVAPGDSLWSIAETIAPGADPREVVSDLVSLNQLTSADVSAGEQLAIPLEYTR